MKTIENADGSKTVYMPQRNWVFDGKGLLEKLNEGDLIIFTDTNKTLKVTLRKQLEEI